MGFSSIKSVFAKPTLLEKALLYYLIFGEGIVFKQGFKFLQTNLLQREDSRQQADRRA